jgi:hypothetical protein
MDISARALLVNTKVRVWTGEKRDKTITREICDMKGAENNAVRANKSLLGEHIHGVQAAERAVRQAVNERTLPWMDDGTRILKGNVYLAFTETMAEPIRAFDTAVDAFIARYPEIILEARRRLGDAFSEKDFPAQFRLKDRFGVKLTFLPVPSTEDFRVNLSDDEIAAVRRNAENALRDTVNDAVRALLDRLQEPVARMATRLRLFRRTSNGKVQHPFRDSLVENVRAIVHLAPTLNLMDDPRIAELCADIERHLISHDADRLRNSARLRETVADEAEAILKRMHGAFA